MSEQTLTVLIVYARFGDGHYQAATALEQQFAMQGRVEVRLVDIFEEAHPVLNAMCRAVYAKSMTLFPQAYGWSYRVTNGMKHDSIFGRWIHALGRRELADTIRESKPDVIVHTFPFLAAYPVMEASGVTIPSYTVITDYELHTRWVHPRTDGYFVATDMLKAQLVETGIREERIHVTGLPIRSQFQSARRARLDICREKGLDPGQAYVMVMIGALSDHDKLIAELLTLPPAISLILVAGRNAKLCRRLKRRYGDRQRLQVIGFVDHMEAYMSVASCVVTKAGAITLTEAIAMQVPVVVFRPIPGQERGNADYWAARYALRTAGDAASARAAVQQLVDGQTAAAPSAGFANAAQAIASEVLSADATWRASMRPDMMMQQGRRVAHDIH
ncbi:MGDG synthase family glycosyltransferase [Cohnella sp. 56]|uniref:MGDG synthase family glycosyltransferase n=1 Tax=Cohnella sp. 56 TaxID=3113722 RepID=UPI0030EAAA15